MIHRTSLLSLAVTLLALSGCTKTEEKCLSSSTECSGTCVNLDNDMDHCGACGNACTASQACFVGNCVEFCLDIAGPALTQNISGWADSGLQITALRNTTLTGFTFMNQGKADTINLIEGTTTVQTISVPASTPTFTASVMWPLTAGTTYKLVSVDEANGQWVNFSGFPTGSASLRVNGTWGNDLLQTAYWFSFVNLATCP